MQHVVLTDPRELACPITDRAERRQLLFHGTTERFAEAIEKEGLNPSCVPYRREDLESLLEIYDALAFEGGWATYAALKVRCESLAQPAALGFTRYWRNAFDYAALARAGTTVMI